MSWFVGERWSGGISPRIDTTPPLRSLSIKFFMRLYRKTTWSFRFIALINSAAFVWTPPGHVRDARRMSPNSIKKIYMKEKKIKPDKYAFEITRSKKNTPEMTWKRRNYCFTWWFCSGNYQKQRGKVGEFGSEKPIIIFIKWKALRGIESSLGITSKLPHYGKCETGLVFPGTNSINCTSTSQN